MVVEGPNWVNCAFCAVDITKLGKMAGNGTIGLQRIRRDPLCSIWKAKPTADFVENGFLGIPPLLMKNAIATETKNRP